MRPGRRADAARKTATAVWTARFSDVSPRRGGTLRRRLGNDGTGARLSATDRARVGRPVARPERAGRRLGSGGQPDAVVGRRSLAARERTDQGVDLDRRALALRAVRRDAARADRGCAAHQRRRPGERRRGLGRPVAQRHQRLLLPVLCDAERHALRVLVGEHGVLAELGIRGRRARTAATRSR